jgi:hypothetical protein
VAAQAQAPAAVRREDRSRRELLGKSRTRKGAAPLPWWIVDRAENGGRSCPDCRGPASALVRAGDGSNSSSLKLDVTS